MKARSRRVIFGGVILLLLGTTTVWVAQSREETPESPPSQTKITVQSNQKPPTQVFPLVSLPASEKNLKLQEIAYTGHSRDRARARYLLAVSALEKNQPKVALSQLKGLAKASPLLSGQILLTQAEAYEKQGEIAKARETWYNITQQDYHPAITGEAFYHLGRYNRQDEETLFSRFPEHPRSYEVIQQRLAENPDQPQLLKILVHYHPEEQGMGEVRDRLVKDYRDSLTPEDWAAIASGYWETWEYHKAGKAYGNAPKTPENLYRHARGLQVSGETRTAKTIYLDLLATFPEAEETGLGLRRLTGMVSRDKALEYLDRAIAEFPEQAPSALVTKANLLDAANSRESAKQARETLIANYSDSDKAAEYRWDMAEKHAQQGQLSAAIDWAKAIKEENPNHSLAAKAGFWSGKWLQQQGEMAAAEASFQQTLSQYPQSYYAWRSAVYLGLPVGNFDTIRDQIPEVVKPVSRPMLPAGSDLLQELYRLGQDEIAWSLWQTEIKNLFLWKNNLQTEL